MSYTLEVTKRTKNATSTRDSGSIPAVVYGSGSQPDSVSVDYRIFEKLYSQAGESSLIDLVVDKQAITKVLIQDIQRDPVKGTIIHADFRRINMDKEMTATIEIRFVGEPPAVKALGGTLNKAVDSLNIKCLPNDLVSHVEVDLSILSTFDNAIYIRDISIPIGITITDNPTTLVAKVAAPLSEDQLKAMEESEQTSVEDIEVEGKAKEDGEGEEGENKKDDPKVDASKDEKKEEGKKEEKK
jgi:large subunit ribosomal protein L25